MTKRVLLRLSILAAVAVAGFLLLLWWTSPRNITAIENLDKINYTMLEPEVVEIMGTAGSDELSNPTLAQALSPLVCKEWKSKDGSGLVVAFNENGKVTRMVRWKGPEETWLDKVRRWLRMS